MIYGFSTLLIALSVGCSMCGHPHDYCGPTCSGDGTLGCHMCGRAGSVIEPYGEPVGTPPVNDDGLKATSQGLDVIPEPPAQPTPAVQPQPKPAAATQPAPRSSTQVQKQARRSVPVRAPTGSGSPQQ